MINYTRVAFDTDKKALWDQPSLEKGQEIFNKAIAQVFKKAKEYLEGRNVSCTTGVLIWKKVQDYTWLTKEMVRLKGGDWGKWSIENPRLAMTAGAVSLYMLFYHPRLVLTAAVIALPYGFYYHILDEKP